MILPEAGSEDRAEILWKSFAHSARMNLHIDVIRGENDHHRAEASFKALALALRMALEPAGRGGKGDGSKEEAGFASTKGGVTLSELDREGWLRLRGGES